MDFNAEVGGFLPLTMDAADSDEDMAIIGKADVSNYNPDHILPEQPQVLHKIREWLDPTPYLHEGGEYRRHLASHVEGTGRWLTATEIYQKWHSGPDHGLLWIKGIPGSGKSVFAATLADVLATEGHPVLFFFFRQIIDANHQPVHMLRDWLDQVLEYSPPLQRDLKVYIDEDRRHLNRELESLGIDQLWKHLKTALAHLPRVYLVADALDEMDRGNDECLKALARLGLWKPGQVKVLITSRPVATVEAPLREFPALRIRLDERLVDTDIAIFVQHSLAGSAIPTEDHDLIKEAVPGRANGLFLYAKLAMDAFLEPGADVRQVLDNLPTDLNAMYANLLAEHARTSGISNDVQRLLLCWVTHATRPLRLLEMAEMLRVTYTASDNHQDLKGAKALIRVACGPLLEIHPDETVSVVHHSLTEFLLGSTRAALDAPEEIGSSFPILMPGPTHEQLALSCIRYLQSSGCLDTGTLSNGSGQGEEDWSWSQKEKHRHSAIRLEFPFAGYACKNWAIHAAKSFTTGQASATLISAVDSVLAPGPRLEAWLRMVSWPHAKLDVPARDIAASYGLTPYLEHLIGREGAAAVTCADVNGETPLFHAAKAGHTAVVKLLLAVGADPNPEDRSGHKPLHLAAKNNHAGVVAALLAAGVRPLTEKTREDPRTAYPLSGGPRTKGSTPLMYACRAGHVAAVEAFLPWLHDICMVHQALDWASRAGQAQVVKRLIQHPGVDVNAPVRGATPLFNACLKNDVDSVEALVLAGAFANVVCQGAPDEFSGADGFEKIHPGTGALSPLEAFCISQKHSYARAVEDAGSLERGLQFLLRAGADIHRRDDFSRTPLHHAAHQPTLLHLLLRAGADPNVDSRFGGTLLHTQLALEGGWEVVKLLVEEGKADINKRRLRDGKTPLMVMIEEHGDLDVGVRFIHAFGPDCTIADNAGKCPLHAAARRGGEWVAEGESRSSPWAKLVDALLAAGARVDQRNHKGETAAHLAESAAVLDRLVSSGADIEARDNRGATVLMRTVGLNQFDTRRQINHLLSIGARMDTRDFRGRTLLHEMVSCLSQDGSQDGHGPGDVEYLLGLGLDPHQIDYDGNTVLHALVGWPGAPVLDNSRRLRMFSYLVRQGVDPDAVNHRGQTVLHILSAKSGWGTPAFISAAIAMCKKETIDIPDGEGRRPIHLAVGVSESTVARLMRAGCDISAPTNEGLTPLHLAASSEQSNILGMLLVEIKAAARYRQSARDIVDSPDNGARTPLYYACLSGRPESVALLLDAGAEVKPWSQSLLTACSLFNGVREVPKVRPGRGVEQDGPPETFKAAAYTTLRHFHTRLDEIMGLLAKHGLAYSDNNQYGRPHVEAASDREHIVSCFSKLRAELGAVDPGTEEAAASPVQMFARRCAEIRRESATRAFQEMDLASLAKGDRNLQEILLVQLLERREFDLVEAAVRTWGWSPCLPGRYGWTLLHALVGLGHASLLARIATLEDVRRIDDAEWRKEQMRIAEIPKNNRRRAPIPPLVLAACERKIPNMLILRFLVEEMKASVNASRVVDVDDHPDRVAVGESPLHVLAKGDQWWQAYEALPYLLLHRPDLEARDTQGNTPLHKALSSIQEPRPFSHNDRLFQKHAATLLVAAGAGVNAVTTNGRTCLSDAVATCDIELVQLLISHGARVTGRTVLAAIESLHRPTLEMLLSTPEVPSEETEVRPPEQVPEHIRDYGPRALYHAAAVMQNEEPGWGDQLDREEKTQKSRKARASMLRTLLAHGADPLGTVRIPKYPRPWVPARHNWDDEGPLRDEPSTVLHHVLLSNGIVEPFLELPTLDLERRNEAGQTILLAACHNASTFSSTVSLFSPANTAPEPLITHLLRRGADPSAVDNAGLTALHSAVTNPVYFSSSEEEASFAAQLQSLLLLPALRAAINTPDKAGHNPLHHALQADHGDATITVLLSAGADPRSVNPATGDNALHLLARRLGSRGAEVPVAMFERFARLGADVNLRNAQGETPMFGAVAEADLQIRHAPPDPYGDDDGLDGERAEAMWRMFGEIGVDFAARDDRGRSLLHVAAEKVETVCDDQTVGVYEKLLKMGVDPLVLDDKERTSVDVAAACGNEAALALFETEDGRRRNDGEE